MKKIQLLLFSFVANPIARNSVVMMAGNMVANVSAYLYHVVVGRILGPDKYGELSALLSLFYILNVPAAVLQTVFAKYFAVFKARKEFGKAKHLLVTSIKITVLLSLCGVLLAVFVSPAVAEFLHIQEQYAFVLLYLNLVTSIFGTILGGALQGLQLFMGSVIAVNINMGLRLGLGYWWTHYGIMWALAGGVVATIAGCIAAFLPLKFLLQQKSQQSRVSRREIAGYAVPTFLATLGITTIFSVDVVLVKHFFPASVAGIYSSLSILGKIVFFATSSIGQVLFPVVAERQELKQSHDRVVYIALLCIAGVSFAISAVYAIFPYIVVQMLFGKAFEGATQYLGWFGIFISFFTIANTITTICLAAGKLRVWIFPLVALGLQILGITVFHQTLLSVIWVNTGISFLLCCTLLLYYRYAKA